MKRADRSILAGLLILVVGGIFWFMVLAPKRERAAELQDQVAAVEAELAQQEQLAQAAAQAQEDYDRSYGKLVTLGKAAPETGDLPALLVQLKGLAKRSNTIFERVTASDAAAIAPPTPAAETTTDQNAAAAPADATATGAPTEATAAALPTGAPVGAAALETQGYELQFSGDFFEIADFMRGLDSQVSANQNRLRVGGRLLTVNGFVMELVEDGRLQVVLDTTSFVLPPAEGLTAGATPQAPPASVPTATAPPAAASPPATTPPTAAATP